MTQTKPPAKMQPTKMDPKPETKQAPPLTVEPENDQRYMAKAKIATPQLGKTTLVTRVGLGNLKTVTAYGNPNV